MSDHTWCLGIRVCGDKRLTVLCGSLTVGAWRGTAPDRHLIGLHLYTAHSHRPAECEVSYKEGSPAP